MKEKETKTQNKGTKVLKTILNTIINIMIVIVLVTSLLVAILALTSKSSGISTIFGKTVQTIQSDSMKGGSPDGYGGQDFEKGDLMIAKATNYDEDAEYDVGSIITYRTTDPSGNDILMSHRIVDKQKDSNGDYRYQTWGDNREMATVPDQENVNDYLHASDIASVFYAPDYQGKIIKGVGGALDYLRTQQGFFFIVLLPMIIFFMYALVRVVLSATGYKKAKADEDKETAVKEAVAAALAEKGSSAPAGAEAPAAPSDMTPEQIEQFKQFMEFQKMQNAAKADEEPQAEAPAENAPADNVPEEE